MEQSYRLITDLVDLALFPALLLAHQDHQRWEAETTLDEFKTHLNGRKSRFGLRILAKSFKQSMAGCWGIGLSAV